MCALLLIAVAVVGGVHIYNSQAAMSEEESNLVFRKALEEALETEGITAESIAVTIEPVYDLTLEQLGFVYFMYYYDTQGFAIVVNTRGFFEVAEFFMQAPDPFAGLEGQRVYLGLMMYLVYYDGVFTDPDTGIELNDEIVDVLYDYALFSNGNDGFIRFTETIHFTNRTISSHDLTRFFPSYLSNAGCVPLAGANIIGYWTRFMPGLVPGFIPGHYVQGIYMYHQNPAGAQPLINDLRQRMGTNAQGGTTIPGFRSGMTSYINSRGRDVHFITTMQGATLNFAAVQQQIRWGRPLAVFSRGFNIIRIVNDSNSTFYEIWTHAESHAMAGFGYNVITYTMPNGAIRTDRFIHVATGDIGRPRAFFNVNFQTQISQVYSVFVF